MARASVWPPHCRLPWWRQWHSLMSDHRLLFSGWCHGRGWGCGRGLLKLSRGGGLHESPVLGLRGVFGALAHLLPQPPLSFVSVKLRGVVRPPQNS